jgi:hypothetical protein
MEDPYDKLKMIAPKTVYAQAKTYYGGGECGTLDSITTHRKIFLTPATPATSHSNSRAKEDPDIAVPKSITAQKTTFSLEIEMRSQFARLKKRQRTTAQNLAD